MPRRNRRFGAAPIGRARNFLVLPSLVLNYLGQGAIVLEGAPTDGNIFYRLGNGSPLEPCYHAIERITAWQGSSDTADVLGVGSSLNARMVETARQFLDLRSALPPRSLEAAPADESDADNIGNAFKP